MANSEHDPVLAITTCLLAGQILVENGSNMERVNKTLYLMAAAAGLESFQAFTTVTGLVASAEHQPNAQVVDIRVRRNDLTRVAQVNEVSRQFVAGRLSLQEAYQELSRIDRAPNILPVWLQCLAAAVLSVVLMVVFTGDVEDTPVGFLIGGGCYWIYLFLISRFKIRYLGEFCTSLVIGLLALAAWRLHLINNVNDVIIGAIMSLVPGIPLTNAARDLVSGNLISGVTRALEAILVAAAIASAIVMVLRFY